MSEEKQDAAEIVTVTELLATEPMTFYENKDRRRQLVEYMRSMRENIKAAEAAGKKPSKKIAEGKEKVEAKQQSALEQFMNSVTGTKD